MTEVIDRCDGLIKAGRIDEVAELVFSLNFVRLPRASRMALAKICRRCGWVGDGLSILYPIIRKPMLLDTPATPGEICEYAVLLSRNGSIAEALELLRTADSLLAPEARLYEGFCHVSSWDYARAKVSFEQYLEMNPDPYSRLIARVNLAACHVSLAHSAATEGFVTETIELAESRGATRLVGNCLELRAQVYLQLGDIHRAQTDLDRALAIFGTGRSYDELLISKWRSVVEARTSGSVQPLLKFREEASLRRHWESVRDTDLLTLKIEFDQRRFDHLLFGSRMEGYRKRVTEQLSASQSETYLWGGQADWLDLASGRASQNANLSVGKKIHNVLVALSKDFYTPQRVGTLFADLYPNEYFDVHASPLRIRQLMKRTRNWLEQEAIPIDVSFEDGGYRLSFKSDFGLLVKQEHAVRETNVILIDELRIKFQKGESFTASEACTSIGVSRTGFLRLATTAVEEGSLLRTGTGKSTRYRVA